MPGQHVFIMSFFIKVFEDGGLRQEMLLQIEEIVAKKTGVNALSVYRYTERDLRK